HSHVIGISFTSTMPEQAAAVVNMTAQLYVESLGDQKRASTIRELAWLDKRIPDLKKEVEQIEAAAQENPNGHGLVDANRTDIVDQQLADINRQLTLAKSDLAARETRLSFVRALQRHGSGMDALLESLDSPALTELHHQELALLQSEAALAPTV